MQVFFRIFIAATFFVVAFFGLITAEPAQAGWWGENKGHEYARSGNYPYVCDKPAGCAGVCTCDSNNLAKGSYDNAAEGRFLFDVFKDGNYSILTREGVFAASVSLKVDLQNPDSAKKCEVIEDQAESLGNYGGLCAYNDSPVQVSASCCCRFRQVSDTQSDPDSGMTGCINLGTEAVSDPGLVGVNNPLVCGAAAFGDSLESSGLFYQPRELPKNLLSGSCNSIYEAYLASQEEPKEEKTAERTPYEKSTSQLLAEASRELNKLSRFSGGTPGVKVQSVIGQGIKALLSFVGSLALVLYIYSGILWMTSGGNTERVEQAKKTILWTTLGLVAIFGSYLIVTAIVSFATSVKT